MSKALANGTKTSDSPTCLTSTEENRQLKLPNRRIGEYRNNQVPLSLKLSIIIIDIFTIFLNHPIFSPFFPLETTGAKPGPVTPKRRSLATGMLDLVKEDDEKAKKARAILEKE